MDDRLESALSVFQMDAVFDQLERNEKMHALSQAAIEARARRAARRVDLIARKSRWRAGSIDNYGEFMLIEPSGNYPVAGYRYDMTAEEVIDYCAED